MHGGEAVTLWRVWAIVGLGIAVFSEFVHCMALDCPEHPRPKGWKVVGNVALLFSNVAAVLILVVT